ncbi:MAG: archease [Candidatus Lindowbacteria bacterium]|nr:archease [Candidatus Lindowbacteria bacterium]
MAAKAVADASVLRGRYKIIEHTADIGISVKAESKEELFALAACAMFDLMVDISKVKPSQKADVSVEADSIENLMVTWLNELVYRAEVSGVFFSQFEVDSMTDTSLTGKVRGEPYDKEKHPLGQHIKAATYHQLKVSRADREWVAKVIFDV